MLKLKEMIMTAFTEAGDNPTGKTIAQKFKELFPEEWERLKKEFARSELEHEANRILKPYRSTLSN
jgi:hypothetical protein